jgi:hypothetical protein
MARRVMVNTFSNARILQTLEDRGLDDRIKILAQGDSWFGFPLPIFGGDRNLIDAISTTRKSVVMDLSVPGDTAENMAKGERFAQLSRILRGGDGEAPIAVAAILLSAGGNDLIDHFSALISVRMRGTPEANGQPGSTEWLEWCLQGGEVIYDHVMSDLGILVAARDGGPSRTAPVILHGYCHLTPRNAPATRFPIQFGPWIWKALLKAGVMDPDVQRQIANRVMNAFNDRLEAIADPPNGVHVLDFRPLNIDGTIPPAAVTDLEPTDIWHDEIHLNSAGWDRVALKKYNPLLDSLL